MPQPSVKKLPIFDKSLTTSNFKDVNDLKEIGDFVDILFLMEIVLNSCSKESAICGAPGFLNLCNADAASFTCLDLQSLLNIVLK